jgi:hypothetical protein
LGSSDFLKGNRANGRKSTDETPLQEVETMRPLPALKSIAAGLLLLTLAGGCCCAPRPSLGWRFEMGRPSTLESPAIIQQQGITGVSVAPLASGLGCAAAPLAMTQARTIMPAAPSMMQAPAAVDTCTLEDICRALQTTTAALNRIELKMGSAPLKEKPEAVPMPKGPPSE